MGGGEHAAARPCAAAGPGATAGAPPGHPAGQLRRPLRRPDARHDGLGHPRPLRRRQPPRGRLAGRWHAQHRRPAARRRRLRAAGPRARPGPAGHAVRVRSGRAGDPRGDLRGDAPGGHLRPPRRRHRDGRLAAGARPGHPHLLRPGRRRPVRGPQLRRRARGVPVVPVRGRPRRHGRAGPGAGGPARGGPGAAGRGPLGEVRLHDPQLPQPGRRHPVPGAPPGDPRRGRGDGPAGHRGQPVRAARLRRRPDPRDPVAERRPRRLPGHVLQDLRAGLPDRLGPRAARRAGEAGARAGVGHALPADLQPVRDHRLPAPARLAGPDQGVRGDVPGAPRRDARGPGRRHAGRGQPGRCRRAASTSG